MSKSSKKYECNLCTEKIIDNDRIICPHCSIEICEPCFQYSIIMELQDPVCIYCKKSLSIEFILSNNSTDWCENTFLEYYSNLLLEKERSKLMDSIPKFKMHLEIDELKKEKNKLNSNKKIKNICTKLDLSKEDFDTKYNQMIYQRNIEKEEFEMKINKLEESLNIKKKDKKDKISYITKCPHEFCKGFINTEYKCELCETEICKACFMIKNENHSCNRSDIESAEMIKKESKPCPGCYVPIFKISGCNQMFCTNCNTVFHWVTLQIDKGAVHNQHYFDYIAKLRNSSDQIRIENAACGTIEELYPRIVNYTRHSWVHKLYLVNQEFNADIIPLFREKFKENFEDYRIRYLYGTLTEKIWKKKIMNDTIFNEAIYSYVEIFEMFVTISSDIIRKICFEIDEILIERLKIIKLKLKNKFMKEYNIFKNNFSYDNYDAIYHGINYLMRENYFYIDRVYVEYLITKHINGDIDWENINLEEHSILDELNILIKSINNPDQLNDQKSINLNDYWNNYIGLKKHIDKCLDDTYQTFGIRYNNTSVDRLLDYLH